MASKNKSTKLNWRYLVPVAVVILLVVVTGIQVFGRTDSDPTDSSQDSEQLSDSNQVDSSDPVEKTKAGPSNKQSGQQSSSGKTKVKVEIVYAGQSNSGQPVMVRGFAEGVFEDGGTCTATFTKGSSTVTGTSKGFTNVSYTQCSEISVPRSQFASGGTWILKLSYSSSSAVGESSTQEVSIQ